MPNDYMRDTNIYNTNMHNDSTHNGNMYNDNTYDDSIKVLRARVIAERPSLGTAQNIDKWWLFGTSGCHLCDIAEQIISQFQAVQPIIYENIDIADFDEALMMEFANAIPVILTPSKRLNYPFSVMDLQQLLTP